MNADLYVGIMFTGAHLNVTTMDNQQHATHISFPATVLGLDAIHRFLDRCGQSAHMAIAIAGSAALELAISLKRLIGAHIFIVSACVASQSTDLAMYAKVTV